MAFRILILVISIFFISIDSHAGGFTATAFWSGNEDSLRQTDTVMTSVRINGNYQEYTSRYSETDSTVSRSITLVMAASKTYDVTVYYKASPSHTLVFPTDTDLTTTGSITIPKGATTATLNFQVYANTTPEADRIIDLAFYATNAKAVNIGGRSYFREIVKDNDQPVNEFATISTGSESTCGITNNGALQCWGAVGFVNPYTPVVIDQGVRYQMVSNSTYAHVCAITTNSVLKCWGTNYVGQVGIGNIGDQIQKPTVIDSGTRYLKISAGNSHTCGITSAGVLKCWGENGDGQLGDNTIIDKTSPVVIDSGVNYVEISGGTYHSCGITNTGVLKCWGQNGSGQIGDGTTTQRLTPVVVDSGTNYLKINAGNSHTCGITTTNALKCWGENGQGEVGDGTNTQRNSPVVINSGVNYADISAESNHSCAVTSAGGNQCWGNGDVGALANGTSSDTNVPTQIKGMHSQIFNLTTGSNNACAVYANGNLKCWGKNSSGKLGIGSAAEAVATQTIVDSGVSYKFAALGVDHGCAISTAGVLKCWGENGNGQLGNNSTVDSSTPVVIDSGVSYAHTSAGQLHTCGITVAGDLKCWGGNSSGQLGNNTTTDSLIPIVINSGTSYIFVDAGYSHTCAITNTNVLHCWGANTKGELGDGSFTQRLLPAVVNSGVSYTNVSTGDRFTCGVNSSGDLQCWGFNSENQVGDGTTTDRNAPVTIGGTTDYEYAFAGLAHACATEITSGTMTCWGSSSARFYAGSESGSGDPFYMGFKSGQIASAGFGNFTCFVPNHIWENEGGGGLICQGMNSWGEWGQGKIGYLADPQVVDSGVTYSKISAGTDHTCAVTSANQGRCWGRGNTRRLTGNVTGHKSVPTAFNSREFYSSLSASTSEHTCGVNTSGRIQCWGRNTNGQGGRGNTSSISTIITTDNGVLYSQIETGSSHTCGITTGGVLKCWGLNTSGQLGDTTNTQRTSPTIINSGTSYSKISTSNLSTCGITTGGVLKCWGDNTNYQLGDGTNTAANTPVVIDSGVNYSEISVGLTCSCGITSGGVLKCWGANTNSCTGDGTTTLRSTPVVIDSGVSYSKISSGKAHNNGCGITTVGVLKCWGQNTYGNVGNGLYTDSSTPTIINSGTSYSEVSTGGATCGITTAGALKCWGNDIYGQVGIGFMPWSYYSFSY